jgi:hypothetical protein
LHFDDSKMWRRLGIAAALAALAACQPGGLDGVPGDADAAPPDAAPPPPDAFQAPDALIQDCENALPNNIAGHHGPPQYETCLNGCHDGVIGPKYTLAGTMFTSETSTVPVDGAAITIIDATGKRIVLRTAQNGNFWSQDTMTFPVTVWASACPTVQPMVMKVTSGDVSCNRSTCHDNNFRVHLP